MRTQKIHAHRPEAGKSTLLRLGMICSLSVLLSACSLFSGGQSDSQSRLNADIESMSMGAGPTFERGTPLRLGDRDTTVYNGQSVTGRKVNSQESSLVLPDGRGGVLIMPGQVPPAQNPNYVDARELKLKMRELASQLVSSLDKSLVNHVALPTAFVSQDDFERSSSLGRFIVEQMFYEFNQRGLPTREYRMSGNLTIRDDGEFVLLRKPGSSALDPRAIYLVGTYYTDSSTIFVNARLIKSDGRVLRTGQLVMPVTPLTSRMLANSGRRFTEGSINVLDFEMEARPPAEATAFDQGMDIH
ncbi:hypothetical protein LJC48_00650 [Desulfovibrio sp. OttesenSCG-928-C06]|nr:hypothetical protein [Desulfovibrio sp. OttesenSCG-928-C06]